MGSLTVFGPNKFVESLWDLIRSLTAFGPHKVVESLWRHHEVSYSIMLGSRKFCQRGSNSDNVFFFI